MRQDQYEEDLEGRHLHAQAPPCRAAITWPNSTFKDKKRTKLAGIWWGRGWARTTSAGTDHIVFRSPFGHRAVLVHIAVRGGGSILCWGGEVRGRLIEVTVGEGEGTYIESRFDQEFSKQR